MKKYILFLFLISISAYSQGNKFTGTWSSENCKDCSKKYILTMNIAQSNSKIFGTAEIVSEDKELSSGVMEVSGYVHGMGEKAEIKLKTKNGLSTNAVLITNEDSIQFNKRMGADLVPSEVILTKLYD
ncbi:hypothetical protein [Flavobacterium hercynium]|uniref:Uncharacterized protein n=1 Tax=Flavobacterium hercynium TaxID=387094 RepID=A0A226H3W8_9FLAO|nr:hypothetical protein [Flavobacterium hercynium]OXA88361.1 hypothetical protein B0A66_15595 [Flavobacterium hercynium]SMP30646.1 hypothetical protein SAMN06265346_113101 [Flavobacterium hercynium]